MAKEVSDKVEIRGKAILKQGAPQGLYFLDGCHADIAGKLGCLSDLRVQLGVTAVKAGYKVGDEFEYRIIIEGKELAEDEKKESAPVRFFRIFESASNKVKSGSRTRGYH